MLGRERLPGLVALKRWENVDTAGHGPHRDHIRQEGVTSGGPPASHRCEETNFRSWTQHPKKDGFPQKGSFAPELPMGPWPRLSPSETDSSAERVSEQLGQDAST